MEVMARFFQIITTSYSNSQLKNTQHKPISKTNIVIRLFPTKEVCVKHSCSVNRMRCVLWWILKSEILFQSSHMLMLPRDSLVTVNESKKLTEAWFYHRRLLKFPSVCTCAICYHGEYYPRPGMPAMNCTDQIHGQDISDTASYRRT